jgi:hypothetical protein
MNPYIQFQQMQDQQGLAPVFQNIAEQQASQNAALNEQNQQVQQAGQTAQGGGSFNNLAMAAMLRKQDPSKPANVYDYSTLMPNTPQYADPAYQQAGY